MTDNVGVYCVLGFETASCPRHLNEIRKTTIHFNSSPQHVINTVLSVRLRAVGRWGKPGL